MFTGAWPTVLTFCPIQYLVSPPHLAFDFKILSGRDCNKRDVGPSHTDRVESDFEKHRKGKGCTVLLFYTIL